MRSILAVGVLASFAAVSAAGAADLPRRSMAPSPAPLYSPVTAFSWTGFYAGVNAGYGWGSHGSLGNLTFDKPSGFVVGGTLGYNHQINQFVVGVEGDLNWTGYRSGRVLALPAPGPVYYTARSDVMGTLRLRGGVALDRALLYVTAGYAGASTKASVLDAAAPATASSDEWRHGWALGAGLEYAFTNSISMKMEYLYTNVSRKTLFAAPYVTSAGLSTSLVRAGVNYHF